MRLSFDSIEEVKEFVKGLKGTRGGKADTDETSAGNAPDPLKPSAGQTTGFAPGATGFNPNAAPQGNGPFGGGAVTLTAEQTAVAKIVAGITGAISGGQPEASVLKWFQNECAKVDPTAANATLDQIKTVYLYKLAMPVLQSVAAQMSITL